MSKLTLHVDEKLIAAAKEEAGKRGTSVSKLVSDFFRALSANNTEKKEEQVLLAPITASLVGCLEEGGNDLEDYLSHLEEKHS